MSIGHMECEIIHSSFKENYSKYMTENFLIKTQYIYNPEDVHKLIKFTMPTKANQNKANLNSAQVESHVKNPQKLQKVFKNLEGLDTKARIKIMGEFNKKSRDSMIRLRFIKNEFIYLAKDFDFTLAYKNALSKLAASKIAPAPKPMPVGFTFTRPLPFLVSILEKIRGLLQTQYSKSLPPPYKYFKYSLPNPKPNIPEKPWPKMTQAVYHPKHNLNSDSKRIAHNFINTNHDHVITNARNAIMFFQNQWNNAVAQTNKIFIIHPARIQDNTLLYFMELTDIVKFNTGSFAVG
jgi:hypothetical protein